MKAAPFPPLVPGGDGLQQPPTAPDALRKRMAEVYGVPAECVLPVRGVAHGLELVLRRLKLDGFGLIAAPSPSTELEQLARIYGLTVSRTPAKGVGAIVGRAPYDVSVMAPFDVAADRPEAMPILVVDESEAELLDQPSLAPTAPVREDLVVLRSLEVVYGLAGAPCGALISSPTRVRAYEEVLEPVALPTPVVRLAEAALSPSRALAVEARISGLKVERARLHDALKVLPEVQYLSAEGSEISVLPTDAAKVRANLARFCAPGAWRETGEGAFAIAVGAPEANDRALAAFGVNVDSRPRRRAEVVRDTKETRIAVAVDLDTEGPRQIHTGVGFYDHMLDQIAAHAGFSLTLACQGDLEIDPHHTIEDCALALGAALKQALGDRRGIGRFGFALPMDEAEAKVLIDLGGRPYALYEGTFETSHIGDWPTEMAPHVFRSMAETLGAAIHVSVSGENDHHKTEAGFKAFGRALRQAIRIEGGEVPSTKGVL